MEEGLLLRFEHGAFAGHVPLRQGARFYVKSRRPRAGRKNLT